ncbi:MAG TPA: PIN domain-containing protein [Candidatus Sulfotelmatobacter sp.]|jgi:predicted nucleic acid-binding protein|nr:PIN domain-containing protein [Candidatus Sulfotelmatobacter sp.]
MSAKYFLDTNVFVYSLDETVPAKARRARDLIGNGLDTGKGIVSFQVVQEFFNAALRQFSKPMSTFAAEEYLNTTFRPLLRVHTSPALYFSALHVYSRYKFSWYDCLIVAAALEAECSVLYTEDMQHGQKIEGLRIEDPFR